SESAQFAHSKRLLGLGTNNLGSQRLVSGAALLCAYPRKTQSMIFGPNFCFLSPNNMNFRNQIMHGQLDNVIKTNIKKQ
ncbi:hypothetical protein ACJX0J_037581, partial [Zea mays]